MRVAAYQLPEVRGDLVRALGLMSAYALEAERRGADLVCFPECFLQGYDVRPEHIASVALELGSATLDGLLGVLGSIAPVIVFGLIEKDGDLAYNSALAIERGKVVARSRKAHLLTGEARVFGRGSGSPIFDVRGVKVDPLRKNGRLGITR